jgi:hypothetical protein
MQTVLLQKLPHSRLNHVVIWAATGGGGGGGGST